MQGGEHRLQTDCKCYYANRAVRIDLSDPITLLYMVEAGNHDIVVVVDPDNNIVETDESNNIEKIGTMKSPLEQSM